MGLDLLIPTIASGIFSAAALLLPTFAVAMLYQHGRYIPLWVPDLGVLGAYVVHAAWTRGVPAAVSAAIALVVTVLIAWGIHRTLIARFLASKDYLSPLLIGLGVSQIVQAVASYYGQGMSQHYPKSPWAQQFYSRALSSSIYWVDIGFIIATVLAVAAIHAYLQFTNWGTKVRMVMANPEDARKLALPVRVVDCVVVAAAAVLVTMGTIMRGIRFDLQPSMMVYPGLGAIAACVVAGPGRRVTALGVIVIIEIVASLVGTVPGYSAFQRAVPFVVLLAALIVRGAIVPQMTAWMAQRKTTTVVPTES